MRARHAPKVFRIEKHQLIEEIAHRDKILIKLCIQTSSSTSRGLEEELLRNSQEYLKKLNWEKELL